MGSTTYSGCVSRWIAGAGIALLSSGPVLAQGTSLVSVDPSGQLPNDDAYDPVISADDRYVAFQWYASFTESDLFLKDRATGAVELLSANSNGVRGNSYSYGAALTPDLRYVAFSSFASNLVAGDSNGPYPDGHDVFVRDRSNGTTERVSIGALGQQGNDSSYHAAISADGRYVAFSSHASNLVGADPNGVEDVFVRDRVAGTTELVSVDPSGAPADGGTFCSAISADGRYVVLHGSASNLVAGDTNGSTDVFVRDLLNGTTERVSVDSTGAQADAGSDTGFITPDGRYVAFRSSASNLVPGDTNGKSDVFVRDRQTGTTERLSVDSGGAQGDDDSWVPVLTPDGRFAAFQSKAGNLVAGDTNGAWDIFVRDRQLGSTQRVSLTTTGAQGDADSGIRGPSISPDGRYVAFDSRARLVPADTDGWHDIYVRDRGPQEPCTTFCAALQNATGSPAQLTCSGEPSSSLVLTSAPVPDTAGLFFFGPTMLAGSPFGDGLLCVGGMTQRMTPFVHAGMMVQAPNTAAFPIDYGAPYASALTGTKYFQHWFRSGLASGSGFHTSSGLAVSF